MFKKVITVMLTFSMMAAMVFTGCGNKAETSNGEAAGAATTQPQKPGEKVKITFWDENGGPTRTPYYDELIKKFHSSQSEVEVEYVGIPQSNSLEKYNVAIAANSMPDAGGVQIGWLSNFIVKKAVIPLDTYMDKWAEKDKMLPNVLDGVKVVATDKKLYMLPNTTNFSCVWYRPDVFKEAGISSFPDNWDDFFKDIEKLTDKGKNKYGYTIRGGSGSAAILNELLFAYSGITDYFDANGKCSINDPKHIEFVKKYLGMYGKNTPESDITSAWKEIAANFDTGMSAMVYHNLGSYINHKDAFKDDSKFAAAPLPKSVKGTRVISSAGSATGYSIFSNSKKADAAWKFISFLNNGENDSYWNENIGQMPTNKDVLNKDWIKKSQSISMAMTTSTDSNTKTVTFPQYLPDYSTILSKTVEPAIQSVMSGKMSVEDLMNTWAQAMEKSKAEYDKAKK